MDTTVWQAFGLTLLAGLSTGIGSLIALVSRRTNRKFLSVALGFSAGVMIYVSLVEILDEARATLTAQLGARSGGWAAAAAFFGGMLVIALIDRLIPEGENPHEVKRMEAMEDPPPARLLRMGAVHGAGHRRPQLPRGAGPPSFRPCRSRGWRCPSWRPSRCTTSPRASPFRYPSTRATGSRGRAFVYSFLSGLAEPLGALAGWAGAAALHERRPFSACSLPGWRASWCSSPSTNCCPAAREYGEHHLSLYGLIAGMALMAVSLLLFL